MIILKTSVATIHYSTNKMDVCYVQKPHKNDVTVLFFVCECFMTLPPAHDCRIWIGNVRQQARRFAFLWKLLCRVARQRPSRCTAKVESPPVSCNSSRLGDNFFWDRDSFNFKCHGRQLALNRGNLVGGLVWDVASCNPALLPLGCAWVSRVSLSGIYIYYRHIIYMPIICTLFCLVQMKSVHNYVNPLYVWFI